MLQLVPPILLAALIASAVLYTGLAFTADPMTLDEPWQWLSAASVASVVVPLLLRSDTVTLTPDALVARGRRPRPIARTAVLRLEVRGIMGVRQIIVHTTDGRRTTLHTPTSLLDREFDQKVEVFTRWWQAWR